ncbi:CHAT domain-containing protein [Desmonostoc muscorum LEGE 12446]|uniref:CHAT domain-containing protein n=1 Tax=Desmonostoc muscorum LEGE 12446 TaxID=1828758 RepID=A0A8J6ZWH2_DESMC|nr:CHAT domain-containing protein [Desmonostoc muscorum]MCF2150125.1 CHAT domain-containing protein [Desmonostoc muscorum LEGE 12446]
MMADKPKLRQRATSGPKGVSQPKNSLPESKETAKRTKELTPKGTVILTEEEELPEIKELCITTKPPKNMAILHIFTDGKNKYNIWGVNSYKKLEKKRQPENKPHLSLAVPINGKDDAKNIKNNMKEFSDLNSPLTKWIMSLRDKFGENLCLVIVDYTNFEIPWEMLELTPFKAQSPPQYIGALITTVRWRNINNDSVDSCDPFLVLDPKHEYSYGIAVAYVLEELQVEKEIKALTDLRAEIYHSRQYEMKHFHTYLHSDNADHSFVYISSHGFFGNSPDEIAIGSQKDKEQQLKLNDLVKHPLNPGRKSQGIVFINACHSAREVSDPVQCHSYRKNFIELFLRQGVRGVIGTLGAVNNDVASDFACELIQEFSQSSDLPVAALLKKLRSKAVENLGDEPTSEQLKFFINTFMYVYYGNPMTVLRLTPSGK